MRILIVHKRTMPHCIVQHIDLDQVLSIIASV
jgi:hypothetical protein